MALILDVVAVALIVLFAVIGYKAGFVKTIIELLGWIAVLLFASVIANQVSALIFDGLLLEPIKKAINESVVEFGTNGIDEYFDGLPGYLTNIFDAFNINAQSVSAAAGLDDIAENIANQLRSPIISLISFILNVVMFVLGIILVKILARLCHTIVSKLPLVSSLNSGLGFITGAVKGFIITLVVAWIFTFVVMFAGSLFGITYEMLDETQVISFLNQMNPLINNG